MGNGSAAVGAALSGDGLQVPPATIAAVFTVKDTITEQMEASRVQIDSRIHWKRVRGEECVSDHVQSEIRFDMPVPESPDGALTLE